MSGNRRLWSGMGGVISLGFAIMFAAPAGAQESSGGAPQSVHKLALYFTSNGWFNCAARADQVARFLGGNGADQMFVVNHPAPSAPLLTVTLMAPASESYAVSDIVFALGLPDCPASYSINRLLPKSCTETLAELGNTPHFSEIGQAGHYIAQLTAWATVRLSPQTTGCLRVQTEIVQ